MKKIPEWVIPFVLIAISVLSAFLAVTLTFSMFARTMFGCSFLFFLVLGFYVLCVGQKNKFL